MSLVYKVGLVVQFDVSDARDDIRLFGSGAAW
jgi:hypothetical protein